MKRLLIYILKDPKPCRVYIKPLFYIKIQPIYILVGTKPCRVYIKNTFYTKIQPLKKSTTTSYITFVKKLISYINIKKYTNLYPNINKQ